MCVLYVVNDYVTCSLKFFISQMRTAMVGDEIAVYECESVTGYDFQFRLESRKIQNYTMVAVMHNCAWKIMNAKQANEFLEKHGTKPVKIITGQNHAYL